MTNGVTYQWLGEFLTQHGFSARTPARTHRIYEHCSTGTQIVLPSRPGRARVSRSHMAVVRGVLRNSGIAYEDFVAQVPGGD